MNKIIYPLSSWSPLNRFVFYFFGNLFIYLSIVLLTGWIWRDDELFFYINPFRAAFFPYLCSLVYIQAIRLTLQRVITPKVVFLAIIYSIVGVLNILALVSGFSIIAPASGSGTGGSENINQIVLLITTITASITAFAGLYGQLTVRKQVFAEIEIEKQKLALEREKILLEKEKLGVSQASEKQ